MDNHVTHHFQPVPSAVHDLYEAAFAAWDITFGDGAFGECPVDHGITGLRSQLTRLDNGSQVCIYCLLAVLGFDVSIVKYRKVPEGAMLTIVSEEGDEIERFYCCQDPILDYIGEAQGERFYGCRNCGRYFKNGWSLNL